MSNGIYSALSGAIAQSRALDVTANNIANARTTGFQADRVAFDEVLSEQQRKGVMPDTLSYSAVTRVQVTNSLGSVVQTGNPLDVALQGEGYFEIETPRGIRYTRGGSLSRDVDGVIRTKEGYAVLGDDGPISIPQGSGALRIADDGTISTAGPLGQLGAGSQLGKLRIVEFEDMTQVQKEGLQLVATKGAQPTPATGTTVLQGFVEGSNVNAIHGMTQLISTTRSYEMLQKVVRETGDLDKKTAHIGGQ